MLTTTQREMPVHPPVLSATIWDRIHQAREQYLAATAQFDDFAQTVLRNPRFVTATEGIRPRPPGWLANRKRRALVAAPRRVLTCCALNVGREFRNTLASDRVSSDASEISMDTAIADLIATTVEQLVAEDWQLPIHFALISINGCTIAGSYESKGDGTMQPRLIVEHLPEPLMPPVTVLLIDSKTGNSARMVCQRGP